MVSTKKLPDKLFKFYHETAYRAIEIYQIARLSMRGQYPDPEDLDQIAKDALPIARAMYEGDDEDLLSMNKTILSAIVLQNMTQTEIPGIEALLQGKIDELNITIKALVD